MNYTFEVTEREKAAGAVTGLTGITALIYRNRLKRALKRDKLNKKRAFRVGKKRGIRQGERSERKAFSRRGNMASQKAKARKKGFAEGMDRAAKKQNEILSDSEKRIKAVIEKSRRS